MLIYTYKYRDILPEYNQKFLHWADEKNYVIRNRKMKTPTNYIRGPKYYIPTGYYCNKCWKTMSKDEFMAFRGICENCLEKMLEKKNARKKQIVVNDIDKTDLESNTTEKYDFEEEFYCERCNKKISFEEYDLYEFMCEECYEEVKLEEEEWPL